METNELNSNFILEQYYTLQCSMICDIIPSCLILGIGYRVLINTSTLLGIFLQLANWVMYKLTNFLLITMSSLIFFTEFLILNWLLWPVKTIKGPSGNRCFYLY